MLEAMRRLNASHRLALSAGDLERVVILEMQAGMLVDLAYPLSAVMALLEQAETGAAT